MLGAARSADAAVTLVQLRRVMADHDLTTAAPGTDLTIDNTPISAAAVAAMIAAHLRICHISSTGLH